MCGISALILSDTKQPAIGEILESLGLLQHRGQGMPGLSFIFYLLKVFDNFRARFGRSCLTFFAIILLNRLQDAAGIRHLWF